MCKHSSNSLAPTYDVCITDYAPLTLITKSVLHPKKSEALTKFHVCEHQMSRLKVRYDINNRNVSCMWVLKSFSFITLLFPVCLDDTFGNDCSLTCDDCSNGGKCNPWKSGCDCPDGWIGIVCNQSEDWLNTRRPIQILTHVHAVTTVSD